MREINRFQLNVLTAKKNLAKSYAINCSEQTEMELHQKFLSSKQEPLKMAIALYCYFNQECVISDSFQNELERFIKARIRNTVEALIEEDAPEKIERLEKQRMFGLNELNGFIEIAREREKFQSMIYLMQVKDHEYGYQEPDYGL